jgi:hypothetical protein
MSSDSEEEIRQLVEAVKALQGALEGEEIEVLEVIENARETDLLITQRLDDLLDRARNLSLKAQNLSNLVPATEQAARDQLPQLADRFLHGVHGLNDTALLAVQATKIALNALDAELAQLDDGIIAEMHHLQAEEESLEATLSEMEGAIEHVSSFAHSDIDANYFDAVSVHAQLLSDLASDIEHLKGNANNFADAVRDHAAEKLDTIEKTNRGGCKDIVDGIREAEASMEKLLSNCRSVGESAKQLREALENGTRDAAGPLRGIRHSLSHIRSRIEAMG